ncbi:hypothetical protein DFP72DRAFT_1066852 [Ephemerocybe angulata]|uniref:Uncharacterized protein n=1 Tax=Ephemerocybe angulata TaxID=980116 RepID=A0A8H6I314_9AGAR|nr:hypothetical protein DFP72DRAFT_1066852 [Tulosesus angulatus]
MSGGKANHSRSQSTPPSPDVPEDINPRLSQASVISGWRGAIYGSHSDSLRFSEASWMEETGSPLRDSVLPYQPNHGEEIQEMGGEVDGLFGSPTSRHTSLLLDPETVELAAIGEAFLALGNPDTSDPPSMNAAMGTVLRRIDLADEMGDTVGAAALRHAAATLFEQPASTDSTSAAEPLGTEPLPAAEPFDGSEDLPLPPPDRPVAGPSRARFERQVLGHTARRARPPLAEAWASHSLFQSLLRNSIGEGNNREASLRMLEGTSPSTYPPPSIPLPTVPCPLPGHTNLPPLELGDPLLSQLDEALNALVGMAHAEAEREKEEEEEEEEVYEGKGKARANFRKLGG